MFYCPKTLIYYILYDICPFFVNIIYEKIVANYIFKKDAIFLRPPGH